MRTATNPQTGEQVQYDEVVGEWVPVEKPLLEQAGDVLANQRLPRSSEDMLEAGGMLLSGMATGAGVGAGVAGARALGTAAQNIWLTNVTLPSMARKAVAAEVFAAEPAVAATMVAQREAATAILRDTALNRGLAKLSAHGPAVTLAAGGAATVAAQQVMDWIDQLVD